MKQRQQQRICQHLGLACTHLRSFLDLPPSFRRKVYEEAGLIIGTTIVLMPRRGSSSTEHSNYWIGDDSFHFTYNILQACRTIRDEVNAVLLAENSWLVVQKHLDYGLRFLRRLSPLDCQHLTRLFVHLRVSRPDDGGGAPLSPRRVTAWQETIAHLLSHVTPQMLKLHIIHDAGDSNNTDAVLEPLRSFSGILADCSVRLSPTKQSHLSTMAMEIATRAKAVVTDPVVRIGSFRFFDLPIELRRSILEYTDLITPYKEVRWSPESGSYIVDSLLNSCDGDGYCSPRNHYVCQFRFCDPEQSFYGTGSFCRKKHSSYSALCRCWCPPTYLKLVSKAMYAEACAVFYSCNRISVSRFPIVGPTIGPDTVSDASKFLKRRLQPEALKHLRILELVLAPLRPTIQNQQSYAEWVSTITQIGMHADISALTLVIHLPVAVPRENNALQRQNARTPLATDIESLLEAHRSFLVPLRAIRGLGRLFVHLNST